MDMFSARCVLLRNVTSGAEEELQKIVDNLQPKCQKSSVKEEWMYILYADQDTATSALQKLHKKTSSGKTLDVVMLPDSMAEDAANALGIPIEPAEEDKLEQAMSPFKVLSPEQQKLMLATLAVNQPSKSRLRRLKLFRVNLSLQ